MWFLFVVPVAVAGAVSALFGLVNGGTLLVVTLAADQWQRRRGHKPGEGVYTAREGGHVFGLRVCKNAGDDLGQFLAGLAHAFPDMFGRFEGKAFDLTESEGEFLRELTQPVKSRLDEYLEVVGLLSEDDTEELLTTLRYRQEKLVESLMPVSRYLRNVPGTRVREAL
jgi:hypothetical protein